MDKRISRMGATCKLKKTTFAAVKHTVILPDCKSMQIRNLLIHYVLTGEILPMGEDAPSDVRVTASALRTIFDAVRARSADDCVVRVDVRDCGAAFRFMMALLAATPGRWLLTGTPRLLQRPIEELVDVLQGMGAHMHKEADGWLIQGRKLYADTLTVDCTRTGQYASALLLTAPLTGLQCLHLLPAEVPSASYIQMTRQMIPWAVDIPELPFRRMPQGGLADWSSALFVYACAMLHPGHTFRMPGLTLESIQGDSVIDEWFRAMGVKSWEEDLGVEIVAEPVGAPLQRAFPVADHPDVVPVMAALACLLPADFRFEGVRNLAYKESNRVRALAGQLAPFADIILSEDVLRVTGKDRSQWLSAPYVFKTLGDHRLAMAFLLFGRDAQLDDVACMEKSWGTLWRQLPELGL